MARLRAITWDAAPEETKALLDQAAAGWELTTAMTEIMANSPAVLQGYFALRDALGNGVLSPSLAARLSLVIAGANRSSYCLAVQTTIGWLFGLEEDELEVAREVRSSDPKIEAALGFARSVVDYRGELTEEEFNRVRQAGYTDEEIAEIIDQIALHIFTNYFNLVTEIQLDFLAEESEGPNVA